MLQTELINRPFPRVAKFWLGVVDDIISGPLRRLITTENHLKFCWTEKKQLLHWKHHVKPGYNISAQIHYMR